jgi:type I restriction enzyme S subunit
MSEWKETEIGKIPKHWELGEFQEDVVVKGRIGWKGYKTSDLVEKGPFVIGGTEIKNCIFLDLINAKCLSQVKYDESPEIMLREGDIILVTRGNGLADIGYFHGEYGKATINPSVIILQSKNNDSKFLFYYLLSKQGRHQVLSLESGSSIPAIYQSDVRKLLYPKPPKKEIEEMVRTIYSIDQKITLLRQQNQDLEELAQTLFKRWFVEFEFPVEVTGKKEKVKSDDGENLLPVTSNFLPYKSSGGKMVESELGEIPEGWRVVQLKDITEIGSSKRVFASEYLTEGVPFYRGKEITELASGKNLMPEIFISEERYKELKEANGAPKENDIILTAVGTIGNTYLVEKNDKFYFKDGNLTWFKDYKTYIDSSFIFVWINSKHAETAIEGIKIGSTQQAITIASLNTIEIVIPSEATYSKLKYSLRSTISKRQSNSKEIQTLTQLRDTLLPKLMSGELRVK